MNTFGERLKQCREERGLSLRELAEIIGLSAANLSRYENGKHGCGRYVIHELGKYFNVNPVWLMGEDVDKYFREQNEHVQIPVVSRLNSKLPLYNYEDIEDMEYVSSYSKIDFCFKVKDDSMINARICPNDIVYVKKHTEIENGEIALVMIKDVVYIRRYYKVGNQVMLKSENPNYKEIIEKYVKVIGKVVAVKYEV